MHVPDNDARRMLIQEHHRTLSHDALRAAAPESAVTETRGRRQARRGRLRRLTVQFRPARHGS
jgi:hypothetical protein